MPGSRFGFQFAPSYRLPAAVLGVLPATAWVEVGPDELRCRFGPWRLSTPLTNVEALHRTGGFSWFKTAGPPHLSFSDRGVSFATNGDDAVCATFREPVRVLDPTGRLRHPGATFTVADPDALVAALVARGVPAPGRPPHHPA
ncbi:hypothetical protein [Nocardioides perillae]|uniref:Uncharacterized protein n=1 Tax=Nocardioides perillae TaxID=1119534 RepID=A0A7Y9RSQ3_9ACTN|nr:hypothetical protein [Nocardioides perillae]NYG55911.1 hypothetical protein [Nocardioides perillae]